VLLPSAGYNGGRYSRYLQNVRKSLPGATVSPTRREKCQSGQYETGYVPDQLNLWQWGATVRHRFNKIPPLEKTPNVSVRKQSLQCLFHNAGFTANISNTICNTRSPNFQNTNNCTYKPL